MSDERPGTPGSGWVDWPGAVPPAPSGPPTPAESSGLPWLPVPPGSPGAAPAPVPSYGGSWADGWDPAWGMPPYADPRPDGSAHRPFPVGRRLGFVDSVRAGLRLAQACTRVLLRDPEDLLVPFAALLLGLAAIGSYVQLLGGFGEVFGEAGPKVGVLKLFPLLLVLSAIDVIAAATLVGAATIRLAGGDPTLTDGWVQALARAPKLLRFAFAWAVQQAFTMWLRQRGRAGHIAADLVDTAWNVATFLAIPVMLYEPQLSATQAVKRSAKLVGQRWGPGLVGNVGLQLAVLLCGVPAIVALALVGSAFGLSGAVAGFTVGLVAVVCVAAALRGIFAAALYRFATTGLVAPGFRDADMWHAFARPPGRR